MIRKALPAGPKKAEALLQAIVAVVTVAALAAGGYAYYGTCSWHGSRRSRSICSSP